MASLPETEQLHQQPREKRPELPVGANASVAAATATTVAMAPASVPAVAVTKEPPPALILHLYPTHFTLGDQDKAFQYNGPLKSLLEAISNQYLPPDLADIFTESDYHNGCVYVQVQDHRWHMRGGRSEKSGDPADSSTPAPESTSTAATKPSSTPAPSAPTSATASAPPSAPASAPAPAPSETARIPPYIRTYVLRPNQRSLRADLQGLSVMNPSLAISTEEMAVEVEAKLLVGRLGVPTRK
ncbi:Spt20 family-domain-containing protein [Blyttiomyces helicus]|uniref:Spt20 family-domain-containing protein n=1 Tax=Blyttiomyces helicus TaxID=388810 RepID=A0A4P9WBQ7_9FUNG|nr:Spt20 family-domain-containing protein [Blyttiomyces helicus]|eukprot:RKO89055.1 Spt20 family-domain-containing protein [Blyttiomyces helicus]